LKDRVNLTRNFNPTSFSKGKNEKKFESSSHDRITRVFLLLVVEL